MMERTPPKIFLLFFRWYCHPRLMDDIEGDLIEVYRKRVWKNGKRHADIRFVIDVLLLFRPGIIRAMTGYKNLNTYPMYKSYFKIGWRSLLNNKGYALINTGGLALGIWAAILIGLWVHDELSYDEYHANYDRIARVVVNHTFNGHIDTQWALPIPLGEELHNTYNDDFEFVSMASWSYGHLLENGARRVSKEGMFVEPDFLEIIKPKMISGSLNALNTPLSIILSQSLAAALFGDADPMGKSIRIDNRATVTVSGIYEDIPGHSSFAPVKFLATWQLYEQEDWVKSSIHNWGNYSFQAFVLLGPAADFESASARIKDIIIKNNERADSKPALFLFPMSDWHLYDRFENGVSAGGGITFVWMFGAIGIFVLLLACINFINLSTARTEKNAREVGVRKVVGSQRSQLAIRFLSESFTVVLIAFILALMLVQLSLDWFNALSGKQITLIFSPYFIATCIAFIFVTALLAGLYPSVYLSSLKTISILRGTFRAGRGAALPRKALIVLQFTVSVTLATSTIVVYRQLEFAKDRPIGYDRSGLITTYSYVFPDHANAPVRNDFLRNELMKTGAVMEMAKSSSPTTEVYSNQSDFDWPGRDPGVMPNFGVIWCSHNYGRTIGFQMKEGRDFSRELATDTAAIIINETAAKFMGLSDPVGKIISYNRAPFTIIGVVNDLLMESPYSSARPTAYMVDYNRANIITMKLNPGLSAQECLRRIQPVFKGVNPEGLFETQFVDEEFNRKFMNEERIGRIAWSFATLSIVICSIGLFGLSSFVAELRTKEIGIRKVFGATAANLWQMLSRDFVLLVFVAIIISVPIAYYIMNSWLREYEYRVEISWWIFLVTCVGALAITMITVSFQALKAALMNPVKSLRSE